ncbi:Rqc2 family fibronectin-binding protein [Acholeplasma hippikon]|uniref:Fibronectin-binding protein A N-terminus (FbpA) n=2 Tax=Acholeplasma hippikon TaxID=264636 RepID=A0A449BJV9_9MOLU|nr:NFACT family protein [Acholeplasma hippikon]VEU82728.1 Fibronectin-binding protein A N-terminus (FbpA) [Acholeplasma hippikon]
MALDGVYTHFLVNELNEKISKSRLESIWSNQTSFIFQFYRQKERQYLNINLNASFASCYLTNNPHAKGEIASFTNQLKKHLEGGILEEIKQYKSDRVIIFYFTYYDFILGPIKKEIIFEAMGRHANLYLIENNKIVDVYKKTFVIDGRHLVPNAEFEFFNTDKLDAKEYTFNPLLTPKELTEKYLGISLRLAKFLCENPINPYDIKVNPTYSKLENKSYYFNLFEGEVTNYHTLSEALDARIIQQSNPKTPYFTFIKNHQKKLDKKYEQLIKQRENAYLHLQDKDKGDLIYQSNYDLNLNYKKIDGIDLDDRYSLSKNAQIFYKNYQKAKRSLTFINTEINGVLEQKQIFDNYQFELEKSDEQELQDFKEILIPYGFMKQSLKKQHKQNKHKVKLLTIKDSEATYTIGKNSLQNGYLMNELGKPNDYWFHVKDAPGSHLLVRCEELSEHVLRKASMLAAHFSSLAESSSIPVNYTRFKYVSKMSGKPASFVKIKNEKTIYIDIDKDLITTYLFKA